MQVTARANYEQLTLDQLSTPLHEVVFCVLDLETTGTNAKTASITEIGAVLYCGGVRQRTFHTLVNPACEIPAMITYLTGITQAMVEPAPTIDQVIDLLVEFIGEAVIVGHNVRFDMSFIQDACVTHGLERLTNQIVDTCSLARRLVRDEVPNCKLSTLAERFSLYHQPNHRALDDALATADLLHLLLERVGGLGINYLDDLIALPTLSKSAAGSKLRLTQKLPRTRGVYWFKDQRGQVIYVGKATNLRSRVRSYFSTETRRKVGALLRETEAIDFRSADTDLEASVLELRLIERYSPRYNTQMRRTPTPVYLRLDPRQRFARFSLTTKAPAMNEEPQRETLTIGPFKNRKVAQLALEALHTLSPLRRCSQRVPKTPTSSPCTSAQLGLSTCPCAGDVDESQYSNIVASVASGLKGDLDVFLAPMLEKMRDLASSQRFEEAASVRDRMTALRTAVELRRLAEVLFNVEDLEVQLVDGTSFRLNHGLLLTGLKSPSLPSQGLALEFNRVSERYLIIKWINQNRDQLTDPDLVEAVTLKKVMSLKKIDSLQRACLRAG